MLGDKMIDNFDKVIMWHPIGNGIKWRYYKHWGQNIYAGERKQGRIIDGKVVDGSGGMHRVVGTYHIHDGTTVVRDSYYCSPPIVVLARSYVKGKKHVSAVLSYPNGLGVWNQYFWEIHPDKNGDCERFDSEKKMETYIKRMLK